MTSMADGRMPSRSSLSSLRVLLVEDTAINRDLVTQILEGLCIVRPAVDGEEGLAMARDWRPDVVLLDLSLPKIDGWTVARRLAVEPWRRETWIIALTAHAMTGDRETALEAGCDDYLEKPLDETLLIRLLQAVAERKRRRS